MTMTSISRTWNQSSRNCRRNHAAKSCSAILTSKTCRTTSRFPRRPTHRCNSTPVYPNEWWGITPSSGCWTKWLKSSNSPPHLSLPPARILNTFYCRKKSLANSLRCSTSSSARPKSGSSAEMYWDSCATRIHSSRSCGTCSVVCRRRLCCVNLGSKPFNSQTLPYSLML